MAQKTDKIYVFSVANVDFGRIVASVDRSGKKIDEKQIKYTFSRLLTWILEGSWHRSTVAARR